jgi:hypothetical protein
MDIFQFVGFLVSVAAIIFIFIRRALENWQRKHHPEEYTAEARKKHEALKQLMRDLGVEEQEEEEIEEEEILIKPNPPPLRPENIRSIPQHTPGRTVQDEFRFEDRIRQRKLDTLVDKRHMQTEIEKRKPLFSEDRLVSPDLKYHKDAYAFTQRVTLSRGRKLISSLRSKKDMIVLQEILDKPKSLRKG